MTATATACNGKRRYDDKKAAVSEINRFRKTRRGAHGGPEDLRAYACPLCKSWHLSKKH